MRDGERLDYPCYYGAKMKIGFYLDHNGGATGYLLADMMTRSVRKVMPDVPIVQLTDKTSPFLYGVDVIRKNSTNRLEHYATLEGEWLLIDSDSIIVSDVTHVFDQEFDIAICDRSGSMLPGEINSPFMVEMPYNLGVVFSRSPEFWRSALEKWNLLPECQKADIVADQRAANAAIRDSILNILILPGIEYNYSPRTFHDNNPLAKILHYKGEQRKVWMINEFYKECGLAA